MDIEYNKLNDDWINKFEETDKLYQDFYKESLYYINLKIIYINKNNEIEKMKQEPFLMTKPNIIYRDEIIQILKNNLIYENKKYTILTILKYIINLDPDDIINFVNDKENFNFLNITKNIDDIRFEKTINMFQDLNDLIFIFYEKTFDNKKSTNFSKKRYPPSLSSNKKTIKNRYKDNFV
jgi:hypothetical protein